MILVVVLQGLAVTVAVAAWGGGARGDYEAPPRYIILAAGPSKQYRWVGQGLPHPPPHYSPPRPHIIPKWIPHMDPTYTALWVPQTPAPLHFSRPSRPRPHPHPGPHKTSHSVPQPALYPAPRRPYKHPVPPHPAPPPPTTSSHTPSHSLSTQAASHSTSSQGFGPPKTNDLTGPRSVGSPGPTPLVIGPQVATPLPLASTTTDPLATFAPAPLGSDPVLRAAPPSHQASNSLLAGPSSSQSSYSQL
ncbi:hypothetical protein Pmani_031038 [Petrolisthes manimaculis]|uniref:Uncharacterized protein n=1 Tax=Petrolisthes manimaculis TaxID=1843537 RepID=A0AAE1NW61_9EUCA|nr:hypothetical protein Pmani_031038 [Petrolisthes manimaculis]